jgi:hypothetical protein
LHKTESSLNTLPFSHLFPIKILILAGKTKKTIDTGVKNGMQSPKLKVTVSLVMARTAFPVLPTPQEEQVIFST